MHRRLCGWKSQCLALARRLTLVQSVTSQLAVHTMQHELLLVNICNELERAQKKIIWGSSEERRKVHAVGWKMLCMLKGLGGFGLSRLQGMNEALLGKLTWNVLARPYSLCSRILCGKYERGKDLLVDWPVKDSDSYCGKGWLNCGQG
ncbi:hypothetical protein K1719_036798 [Acacia pycnantha]|nr:hypothetical protein K1719_036798 [Acacia pycnantha]